LDNSCLGVLVAVTAVAVTNFGIILQEKGVNEIPTNAREKRFFRSPVRNPK
jgi:hypothetical protein